MSPVKKESKEGTPDSIVRLRELQKNINLGGDTSSSDSDSDTSSSSDSDNDTSSDSDNDSNKDSGEKSSSDSDKESSSDSDKDSDDDSDDSSDEESSEESSSESSESEEDYVPTPPTKKRKASRSSRAPARKQRTGKGDISFSHQRSSKKSKGMIFLPPDNCWKVLTTDLK